MISPSLLRISSPTITVNGAISFTASAPRIVLWSVTATQVSPLRRQVSTKRRGEVMPSGE